MHDTPTREYEMPQMGFVDDAGIPDCVGSFWTPIAKRVTEHELVFLCYVRYPSVRGMDLLQYSQVV